ncbi:Syndetin [Nymphaea thermarum]|nr:Syndetin [Nymphaea thermarum]
MQLVMEVEHDLKIANVICMNGRRHVRSSMHEVSRDLVVTSSAKKKQALLDLLPVLTQLRHALDMQVDLDTHVENGNYVRAFQVLSEYLQVLDGFSNFSAVQEMIHGAEVWLEKALQKLDSQLLSVCQEFKEKDYVNVVDAYALVGDVAGLVEKMQSFYMQEVLSDTQRALKDILQEVCTPNCCSLSMSYIATVPHKLSKASTYNRLYLFVVGVYLAAFLLHDLNLQDPHKSRLTYSDLCLQIPESKFRRCLLYTLNVLFKIMSSYYAIMSFRLDDQILANSSCSQENLHVASSLDKPVQLNAAASDVLSRGDQSSSGVITYGGDGHVISDLSNKPQDSSSPLCDGQRPVIEAADDPTPSSSSSCDQLRKESVAYIAQALQKGRRNLWHLTASRVSVLLSCSAASSTSTHQFLKNYEDLNSFVLAGEAFCGAEASEFRQRLKIVSENYLASLHRQKACGVDIPKAPLDRLASFQQPAGSTSALKMVLEKETWLQITPETVQMLNLAGLVGDGAPVIVHHFVNTPKILHSSGSGREAGHLKSGFARWFKMGNPFDLKHVDDISSPRSYDNNNNGSQNGRIAHGNSRRNEEDVNGPSIEDENEDLLADFIDEDSQLPSRISRPSYARKHGANWEGNENGILTGSSLSLLRLMDKYARLMQKLGVVNIEFFKGICQLFELYFYVIFETFGHRDAFVAVKGHPEALTCMWIPW